MSGKSGDLAKSVAQTVCEETKAQLTTLEGGNEIFIRQCESQSNSAGEIAFIIRLNDPSEWRQILSAQSTEEVVFIIPLGLVAYGFGGSSQDPDIFNQILVVFDDVNQTVYNFTSGDLAEVLRAETQEEAEKALKELSQKMQITTLG
jgi:hypothetical protein